MAGAIFTCRGRCNICGEVQLSLLVAGAFFCEIDLAPFGTDALFGEVPMSLFVAGAIFCEVQL